MSSLGQKKTFYFLNEVNKLRILFLGDIVGRAAREKVVEELPSIKNNYSIDFAIVNGENC